MPIEIRELVIKATVNDQQAKDAASAAPESEDAKDGKKMMMQQCIDDIMDIINSKKER
jgi:hypothetical protein